jgi:hypothetical protein
MSLLVILITETVYKLSIAILLFVCLLFICKMILKSVNNLGTKVYNKLPNYLKNLESLKLNKKQLKSFYYKTFYSVDEFLSYVQAPWKGIL